VENNWAFKCGYGLLWKWQRVQDGKQPRPVFGILYKTMLRWSNAASGFYANILRAATPGTNNTSYSNGTSVQHAG